MFRNWKTWLALGVGAALLFAIAISVIGPAPPKSVRIASGTAGGAYASAADVFADALRAEGIEVVVLETAGSMENLARLQAKDDTAVDIALVQSGIATLSETTGVDTLGALFVEPVWLFTLLPSEAPDVQSVAGARVATGAAGSGSQALWTWLARENAGDSATGFLAENVALGGREAVEALRQGRVDSVFTVASPRAAWVQTLLETPGLRLVPFTRAAGYERRASHLRAVTLRRGVLSMERDEPREDVPLLAATAQLAVRSDLHPAVQSLLLQAARERFSGGDALSAPGTFPSRYAVDLPVSEEATRFYENGPTTLRRYLPFWAANIVERAWMLILPALVLASPLVRSFPPVYRWRTRRKIYLWYRDLRALEERGRSATDDVSRGAVRAELDALQAEVGAITVPEAYSDELFRLREHIVFVDNMMAGQTAGRGS
ncbi:MAG: TAXI family TRAP transporter solute-binding subunit [Caulobacterales bacterium]